MKKLLILCLAFVSGTAVFAQQGGRDRNNDHRSPTVNTRADNGPEKYYAEGQRYGNRGRYGKNDYQYAPVKRRGNDYQQRDERYGHQRFGKNCENTNNRFPQRGRTVSSGSLGKGIAIGAVAGIILGAVLSN